MLTRDFDYHLPKELIAQFPASEREGGRLLVLDRMGVRDHQFIELTPLLQKGDLLVFNDTKVIPARLYGVKSSGGKIEVLVERIVSDTEILAHIKASKSPKIGALLILEAHIRVKVVARKGALYHLEILNDRSIWGLLDDYGHIPLPPYIQRSDTSFDQDRYQTVYAQSPGAVAAPTAGLHFSQKILDQLATQGIETAFVTLHVGAGTFQPVRVERLQDHIMHHEYVEVTQTTCDQILRTKQCGGRIIAVGTTSVRCLESAAQSGRVLPYRGDTNLFIYPGYTFQCVDQLVTNFHLPQSTLLMLVCAFAGHPEVMRAYQHAIKQRYRFFSYGDAMLLSKKVAHEV